MTVILSEADKTKISQNELFSECVELLQNHYPDLTLERVSSPQINHSICDFQISNRHFEKGGVLLATCKPRYAQNDLIWKSTSSGFERGLCESYVNSLMFERILHKAFPETYVGPHELKLKSEITLLVLSKSNNALVVELDNGVCDLPFSDDAPWGEVRKDPHLGHLLSPSYSIDVVRYPSGTKNFFAVVRYDKEEEGLLDYLNNGSSRVPWHFIPFREIWRLATQSGGGGRHLTPRSKNLISKCIQSESGNIRKICNEEADKAVKDVTLTKRLYGEFLNSNTYDVEGAGRFPKSRPPLNFKADTFGESGKFGFL